MRLDHVIQAFIQFGPENLQGQGEYSVSGKFLSLCHFLYIEKDFVYIQTISLVSIYALKSYPPMVCCLSSPTKLCSSLSTQIPRSFSAAPQPVSLQPALVQVVISSQIQDFIFNLDEFHKVLTAHSSSLWLCMNDRPDLQNIEYNHWQQLQKEYTQDLLHKCYPKCVKVHQLDKKTTKKKKNDACCQ